MIHTYAASLSNGVTSRITANIRLNNTGLTEFGYHKVIDTLKLNNLTGATQTEISGDNINIESAIDKPIKLFLIEDESGNKFYYFNIEGAATDDYTTNSTYYPYVIACEVTGETGAEVYTPVAQTSILKATA